MKVLKKILNIFTYAFLAFIIINILIGYLWSLKTQHKFKDYKPYSKEILRVLELNEKESLILYLETWQQKRLYEYDQFTGHVEFPRKNFKYVNFSKLNGRKINNKDNCVTKIFFYGGESTFGYNVTDEQTFSYYFKDILNKKFPNKNFCVFNFGRGRYFSTQENILFQKHLLKKRFQPGDFIFFVDGLNEGGNKNVLGTKYMKYIYNVYHHKYWDLYKYSFPLFLSTLPIFQFVERIHKKNKNHQQRNIFDNKNTEELIRVFQNNVDIRLGICKKFILNCYTLLQPFPGIHGIYFGTQMSADEIKINQKKYSILKRAENIVDITTSFNNEKELSYIDGINYSPPGNKSIAEYIYQVVEEKIKSIN